MKLTQRHREFLKIAAQPGSIVKKVFRVAGHHIGGLAPRISSA